MARNDNVGKLDLSKFGAVERLMKDRSAALMEHEKNLQHEVHAHDGSHAYGRHGFQTGWEQQFIRCVTGVRPDQKFDPMGIAPSIHVWNAGGIWTQRVRDENGMTTVSYNILGPYVPAVSQYERAPGKVAGGFLSPEMQHYVRMQGLAEVTKMTGDNYFGAEYSFRRNPTLKVKMPFSAFSYGVYGRLFGMGYRRTVDNPPQVTLDFVQACIDGFYYRRSWKEICPNPAGGNPHFALITHNPDFVPFKQIGDLFRFFCVETFPQKGARIVFRRPYSFSTKSFTGPWRIVTMFPDDKITQNGWTPGVPFLSEEIKRQIDALKRQRTGGRRSRYAALTKDKDDYIWTGRTCNKEMNNYLTHVIPTWT